MLNRGVQLGRSLSTAFSHSLSRLSLNLSRRNMPEPTMDRSYYTLPNETPVCALNCTDAFELLSAQEKLYAHHMAKASFDGSLIVYHQTSPESPLIFYVLQRLFRSKPQWALEKLAVGTCGFTQEDFIALQVYASGVSNNYGNYKGFGDTKIIPNLDREKVEKLIKSVLGDDEKTSKHLPWILDKMFGLSEREKQLGIGMKGVTTYLSTNITEEDSERVSKFMKENQMEGWNTRLFKTTQGNKITYEIRLASVEEGEVLKSEFDGCSVVVTKGDYAPLLKRVIQNLTEAQKHALNENQRAMITEYISHFTTGNLDAHKNGSRHWIKDKGPAIENYIGFIENYRDPVGVRAEFEGFVAAVNKETSKKFGLLVENAEELIKRLPWSAEYEKDGFMKPDFTSLDVLAFGGSGIPAGINIPNYDEIRQNEGFKNVSLGNVIAAIPNQRLNFLSESDEKLMKKYHSDSFEVQVGLHELLGHGSGKLFEKKKNGDFNFDAENTKDMETGGKITSWYEEGETWSTKFGPLSSAYEECRAEAVGYVLCCYDDVLKIFGFDGEKAQNIKYVNWLSEIRAGLMGLEYYFPDKVKWGQAHCHARYALLNVALEAGQGFVKIEETTGEDGDPDLLFSLDRSKIDSVGKPATEAFLKKLQLYKATGDFEKGKALFDKYGNPDEKAVNWRKIVIARRKPSRFFVQNTTFPTDDGEVMMKTYPENFEGMIDSQIDRYPDKSIEDDVYAIWEKDNYWFQ